jgi:hypothetical protein
MLLESLLVNTNISLKPLTIPAEPADTTTTLATAIESSFLGDRQIDDFENRIGCMVKEIYKPATWCLGLDSDYDDTCGIRDTMAMDFSQGR